MYKLVCMSFDGDIVTEGEFNTIADVWARSEEMSSRWFFYPFHFAVTENGKSIACAPFGLEHFNGKRLKTVRKAFETVSKLPETQGVDAEVFALYL